MAYVRGWWLAGLVMLVLLSGCGLGLTNETAAPVAETGDTATTSTTKEKAAPDTAAPDTAAPDTAAPDTAAPDATAPDATTNIDPSEAQPDPLLSPQEVVRIQLTAMSENDSPAPDSGIRTAFRFASPANQAETGPVDRFIELVKNPPYSPMLNSRLVEYGPTRIDGDAAVVPVLVVTAEGDTVGYLFGLTRQTEAPYEDCWMTDAVVPIEVPPNHSTPTDEI